MGITRYNFVLGILWQYLFSKFSSKFVKVPTLNIGLFHAPSHYDLHLIPTNADFYKKLTLKIFFLSPGFKIK